MQLLVVWKIYFRFGLSSEMFSHNGPPVDSIENKYLQKHYSINLDQSCPYYLQSNERIERHIQTAKNIIRKAKDPF